MNIRFLFLSLLFLSIPIASAKACPGASSEINVLLGKAPKHLHNVEFMGQIEVTRKNQLANSSFVAMAKLLESKTHQNYKGQAILFLYSQTSCGPHVRVGDKGYLMGNVMTIDSGGFPLNSLVVDPYKIRGVGEEEFLTYEQMQETLEMFSTDWGIREVYTDEEVIPLWKFYFDDLDTESDV